MPRKFAEGTDTPVAKTRAELEDMLSKFGAEATAVFNKPDMAMIAFEMHGRRILMKLALPDPGAREFTHGRVNQTRAEVRRSPEAARARHERACRQKWRALLLAVKAKLVSVTEGVETFEDAFMAHVVMPDGQTVSDHISERIASAYKQETMVPLLPYRGVQ
jgi:hypothetical protein